MDILCRKCGESWDLDSLHEEVERRFPGLEGDANAYRGVWRQVAKDFRDRGCPALGATCGERKGDPAIGALYDVLGDDMDGAAAEMEDLGL